VLFTVGGPVKDESYFRGAINDTEIITVFSSLERIVTCSWELGEVAK
jgi:hypothetical protein